jgi:DNA-binding transcriptional ArsR family regulator
MPAVRSHLRRWRGLVALGDPTRRAIIAALAERPRAVGEIAEKLPVSRPAVSQALKVLKDAGLMAERAVGTRRIYRLNPTAVAALRDQLDTYWSRAHTNRGELPIAETLFEPWVGGHIIDRGTDGSECR